MLTPALFILKFKCVRSLVCPSITNLHTHTQGFADFLTLLWALVFGFSHWLLSEWEWVSTIFQEIREMITGWKNSDNMMLVVELVVVFLILLLL